ncbi:MAG: prolyl oligopeptidase family serine peptidase [Sphingobacteriales bacterium JAD_PAG50586_3]|nr:MAG: prolyl oligopeptidase family serine peptidase [Sphingobacteriales bacterium JAD_PAG50586_3]
MRIYLPAKSLIYLLNNPIKPVATSIQHHKMRSLFTLGLILVFAFAHAQDGWKDSFTKHNKVAGKDTLPYRYYSPKTNEDSKLPLVIFLHGAGERGNDNNAQLLHGVKYFMADSAQSKYTCAIFAPQCPTAKRWVETDWKLLKHTMPAKPSDPMALVFAVLDSLKKLPYIDSTRIYITGLSMGGYGIWDAIQRRPNQFAAAVPICGGGDEAQAPKLKSMHIWAFHGTTDKLVKPERTRNMIAAINAAGGHPKVTYYETGHFVWDQAYTTPDLFKWMFFQSKK